MSACHSIQTRDKREKNADQADLVVRLLKVFRAASLLATRLERVGQGTYQIEPADVLALRSAVARAALSVEKNGVTRWGH